MATTGIKAPAELSPDCVYPLRGIQAFGISATRMREGRQAGITLTTIEIGRRKFVRGSDAIAYLEKLATVGAKS